MIGTWISVQGFNMKSKGFVGLGKGERGNGGGELGASENVKSDLIQTLTYRDTFYNERLLNLF